MEKKKFGLFIKESRLKQGLTQKDLADKLYLDVTAVSKWERGVSYPDITLIPDLCKILDVNEHELIESGKDTEYRKMKRDADQYNKIKNIIFNISTILYISAILICFIVNIAVNKTLDWFFIVFSSCLCAFTFCPTILRFVRKFKLTYFLLSTFASLFILYLTCSIYTHNYWFMIATVATLLGYFVIFYPILFFKQNKYLDIKIYEKLKKFFVLTYITGITLLTGILLVFINLYEKINLIGSIVVLLGCSGLGYIFGVIYLIKMNKFIRCGSLILSFGAFCVVLPFILQPLVKDALEGYFEVDFTNWIDYSNGNVSLILLITTLITGITFIVLGIINKKRKGL